MISRDRPLNTDEMTIPRLPLRIARRRSCRCRYLQDSREGLRQFAVATRGIGRLDLGSRLRRAASHRAALEPSRRLSRADGRGSR